MWHEIVRDFFATIGLVSVVTVIAIWLNYKLDREQNKPYDWEDEFYWEDRYES